MEWYVADENRGSSLKIYPGEDLGNEKVLSLYWRGLSLLDGSFDFEGFDRLTEKALHEELPGYNYAVWLEGVESVMTQLKIMPFDEEDLPPEKASTF